MKKFINHIKNSEVLFVNTQTINPNVTIKHIPFSVNKRLNNISWNKGVFDNAKGEYERLLKNIGYIPESKLWENQH